MILTSLKESTRVQHEQAERAMNLSARLQSVETYSQLLSRFFGFYAPLEANLSEVSGLDEVGVDVAARRKSQRLRNDLLVCGWDQAAVDAIPYCGHLPTILDVSTALGCLYVMEGATLGGQIIRREVHSHLGFTPDHGGSFFSSYGDRTREMWTSFSAAVEAYSSAHPGVDPAILSTAQDTFARFEGWIARR